MRQDAVLAMLAKEPRTGTTCTLGCGGARPAGRVDERRSDLCDVGPVGEGGAGPPSGRTAWPDRPERKVYALTPAGQQRVAAWLAEVSWPRPDLAEFHLKLAAAAAARLADPVSDGGGAAPRAAAPLA